VGDLDLFQFADTPEEAFALLKAGLTENHLESEYEREQSRLEKEEIPKEPAPSAQEMMGPDITKTR
jgi:predicted RNase H-like HicB family nuclease